MTDNPQDSRLNADFSSIVVPLNNQESSPITWKLTSTRTGRKAAMTILNSKA